MSFQKRIEHLVDELPASARHTVAAILSQIAHDLNTPVSTLTMEIFSAHLLVEQLRSSSAVAGRLGLPRALADIEEVCSNLQHTATRLAEDLKALECLATASGIEE